MPTLLTVQTEAKTAGDKTYTLITLTGQIDESNLEQLSQVVDPLIGAGSHFLVFNLAALEFINSKVIGYLAATHGQLTEADQAMIFVQANESILDILELVGLTQIVPTLPDEAAAAKAILAGEI